MSSNAETAVRFCLLFIGSAGFLWLCALLVVVKDFRKSGEEGKEDPGGEGPGSE